MLAVQDVTIHQGFFGRPRTVILNNTKVTNVLGATVTTDRNGRPVVAIALSPLSVTVTQPRIDEPTAPPVEEVKGEAGMAAGPYMRILREPRTVTVPIE